MLNVDMQAALMALAGIGGLILLILLVYIVILHKKIRNELYLFYARRNGSQRRIQAA